MCRSAPGLLRLAALAGTKAGALGVAARGHGNARCWQLAVREPQEGRQYKPVVATDNQNEPSAGIARAQESSADHFGGGCRLF